MKKILIAAAVVGAFSGVAQAQSSVTLYGVADVGVRIDRSSAGTVNSLTSGELAGSRWGMRGTEDLGNGLKANFMIEAGFALDTGNTVANAAITAATPVQIFNRTSYAGLSGDWGNARLGNDYSPHFLTYSGIDPFGAASISTVTNHGIIAGLPTSNILGTNAATAYTGGSTRMTNTIFYDTPNISGFVGRAAYKFGESVQVLPAPAVPTKSAGNAYSLSGTYANGPVLLSIANYEATQAAGVYAANSKKKDMVYGGTYDFGVAKVAAQIFSEKATLAALTSYSTRTTEIGVTVPVGAWTIKAQYSRYNDRAATNLDATAIGLGADYSLSKRSTLYARYSKLSNSTLSTMGVGGGLQGGTGNITAGSSPSAITAGLNLKF